MSQPSWLLAAMFGSVLSVGLVMFVDEQREFEHALEDLQNEQTSLATAIGADFEARLERMDDPDIDAGHLTRPAIAQLLGGAAELEQPGSRLVLIAPPTGQELVRTNGRRAPSNALRAALVEGAATLTLSREQAAQLELPRRLAVAGLQRCTVRGRDWGTIVVASAERLRARERHAQLRFSLGLLVVSVLVAGFGGLALRDQRRKLEVARALDIAALQREAERLLSKADKMATLAALSSGIAHQIATPLGTIVARVEQVLPAVAGIPKATAALEVIAQQVARIQRMVGGLLDLARGHRPTLVKAQPSSIVHAGLQLVQHRFNDASIQTELHLEPDLGSIACDPPMLEQALVNLLLNACEASSEHATIRISLRSIASAVQFVVEDEGEGISDETAARAREPFFTTKAKHRGTGLGLAIAHEVVANHGGTLMLGRREDRRGTRAVIELPVT